MATKLTLTLTVTLQHKRNEGKGAAKCPWITCVTVWNGADQVAIGTVGGYLTEAEALKEFQRTANDKRWHRMGGWTVFDLHRQVNKGKAA